MVGQHGQIWFLSLDFALFFLISLLRGFEWQEGIAVPQIFIDLEKLWAFVSSGSEASESPWGSNPWEGCNDLRRYHLDLWIANAREKRRQTQLQPGFKPLDFFRGREAGNSVAAGDKTRSRKAMESEGVQADHLASLISLTCFFWCFAAPGLLGFPTRTTGTAVLCSTVCELHSWIRLKVVGWEKEHPGNRLVKDLPEGQCHQLDPGKMVVLMMTMTMTMTTMIMMMTMTMMVMMMMMVTTTTMIFMMMMMLMMLIPPFILSTATSHSHGSHGQGSRSQPRPRGPGGGSMPDPLTDPA